jgi:hypothetical protein
MITAGITIHTDRFGQPDTVLAEANIQNDAEPERYRLVLRRVADHELADDVSPGWPLYVLEDSITGEGACMLEFGVAADALAMFLRLAADRVQTLDQPTDGTSPLVDTEREQSEAIRAYVYGDNDHPDVQNADRAAIYDWLMTDRFPPENPITSLALMWNDTANENGYNRQRILRPVTTEEGARA